MFNRINMVIYYDAMRKENIHTIANEVASEKKYFLLHIHM